MRHFITALINPVHATGAGLRRGLLYSAGMVDSLLRGGSVNRRDVSRRAGDRLLRTILLGTVAFGFAIYWLADSYGADWRDLGGYLLVSLGFVGIAASAGLVGLLLLRLLRRALRRRNRGTERSTQASADVREEP